MSYIFSVFSFSASFFKAKKLNKCNNWWQFCCYLPTLVQPAWNWNNLVKFAFSNEKWHTLFIINYKLSLFWVDFQINGNAFQRKWHMQWKCVLSVLDCFLNASRLVWTIPWQLLLYASFFLKYLQCPGSISYFTVVNCLNIYFSKLLELTKTRYSVLFSDPLHKRPLSASGSLRTPADRPSVPGGPLRRRLWRFESRLRLF